MALPILNDLKDELERLYIAGSTLAKDDPRIKKYIPGLNKLGERAPVFRSLSDRLTALTQNEASPENLMEAGSILFSLIYSQAKSDNGSEVKAVVYSESPLPITRLSLSEINAILASIKPRSIYCEEKLKELYLQGYHRDPRLFGTFVMCVKQGNAQVIDAARRIILSLNESIVPIMENELDIKGGAGDAKLFRVLYEKLGDEILPLSERILAEGSQDVLAVALETLGNNEKYKEILKNYAKDRRKDIKEAAKKALSSSNS